MIKIDNANNGPEDVLGYKPVDVEETQRRKSPSNAGFERQEWWHFRHHFTQRQLVIARNNGIVTDDMVLSPTPGSNGYPRIATVAAEAMIEAGMKPSGRPQPIDWPGKYTTHPAPVAVPTKQEAQAKIKEGLVALLGGKREMTLDDLVGEMVNAMAGDKDSNDASFAE